MEGVRRTLDQLGNDAKPQEIRTHLKREFGIDMETNMISNYKSMIKSGGNKSGLIRRPRGSSGAGGFSIEDIQAVKEIADRIGADKVRQLASVL